MFIDFMVVTLSACMCCCSGCDLPGSLLQHSDSVHEVGPGVG